MGKGIGGIDSTKMKKYLLLNMPYIIIFIILLTVIPTLPLDALPFDIPVPDMVIALVGAVLIRVVVYFRGKNAKKYRKDIEYGSARWGTEKDIKPYIDPKPERNIILTQTESLTMESRPKMVKYARNKNVLIIGGSGSGKTRFFVKPNLLQAHSSYIVTDPKGTLVLECGKFLQDKGYNIKILNTIDFKKSHKYNPFAYIRSEKDILKLVTALIENTKGDGKSGDEFWTKAEKLLYQALIGYIYYEAPPHEQNMNSLVEMINKMEVREDNENFKDSINYGLIQPPLLYG